MRRMLLFFCIFLCAACATTELVKLESEIKPILEKHESISKATRGLQEFNFNCIEGTSIEPKKKSIYECIRAEGNIWPPFSCIHRVWLKAADPNSEVFSYEIFKPVCAGL